MCVWFCFVVSVNSSCQLLCPVVCRDRRVTSYFETENEHVDYILPMMTVPFDFKKFQ